MYAIIPIWIFKPEDDPYIQKNYANDYEQQRLGAINALKSAAQRILREEPGTLTYLVQLVDDISDIALAGCDVSADRMIVFHEVYANKAAFEDHLYGEIFQSWLKAWGHLFIQKKSTEKGQRVVCEPGKAPVPGNLVPTLQLDQYAGFVRSSSVLDLSGPHD